MIIIIKPAGSVRNDALGDCIINIIYKVFINILTHRALSNCYFANYLNSGRAPFNPHVYLINCFVIVCIFWRKTCAGADTPPVTSPGKSSKLKEMLAARRDDKGKPTTP